VLLPLVLCNVQCIGLYTDYHYYAEFIFESDVVYSVHWMLFCYPVRDAIVSHTVTSRAASTLGVFTVVIVF
jgi:hypothetical protein